jgi:hypothetical protein
MENKLKFKKAYKKLCKKYNLVVDINISSNFIVKSLDEKKKETGEKYLDFYFEEDR